MNLFRRIASSSYVKTRFRWPSARTLLVYWCIVAILGVVTSVDASYSVYQHAISAGQPHPAGTALLVSLANLLAWAILGGVFFLMWGMYYRMFTEIAAGYRKFRAWLPGAMQSLARGAAAFINFLRSIPSYIGAFFRGIGRAFAWVAGRPAWWRGLNSKQKASAVLSTLVLAAYFTILALFYPVARHMADDSPKWMRLSDSRLLQSLFYDVFLGSFIAVFGLAIVATVFDAIGFGRRKK